MTVDLLTTFGAGILTLGSPCVLPLVPIYLGMLLGSSLEAVREPGGRAKLLTSTLAFSFGFGLVFTLLGLGASSVGRFLQEHRAAMLWGGGALVIVFGLKFLKVIRIPFLDREKRFRGLKTGSRLLDAAIFGVVFALGWTPCVGPILGSVLTYTASRTADPLMGALYLAVYSSGLALPLLVIGFASDRLLPLLMKLNQHLPKLEKVTGVALVLVGVWLITSAATVPGDDPDVPAGPAYARDGTLVEPYLGQPSDMPRFVEFYTQSCPTCKTMAPRIEALKKQCVGRRIEVIQIDVSDPRNRPMAEKYRLRVVPTMSLLAPDGREVRRLLGEKSSDDLMEAAASLIDQTCAGFEPVPLDFLDAEPGVSLQEPARAEG